MRRWLMEHVSPVIHVVVGLLALLLLAALGWSIGRSDLNFAMFTGGGIAVVIVMGGSLMTIPDNMQSRATDRMLRLASATLMHMRDGLTPESCQAVCRLLLPETQAAAIAITNTVETLAYAGEPVSTNRAGSPNNAPVLEVLESGHIQTFSGMGYGDLGEKGSSANLRDEVSPSGRYQNTVAVIIPLIVSDRAVGTIKLYYRSGRDVDRTQMTIARGLADLLSSQLTVSELDRQSQLTAQAEVKALQAQINPHFLFNTLNTMASLTRTDPTRARELLREFSTFYRRTLENSQQLIPLADELEQTRRYLHIEKARFGEERILETEKIDHGCESVMVPGFIVQPIVENAVRHAMSDVGPLHIDVDAFADGYDLILVIADDGLGMDAETAARLLEGSSQESSSSSKGTGIALRNVRERIKLFYGASSDVAVSSVPGEGTSVTLRLAGAAPVIDFDDESYDELDGYLGYETDEYRYGAEAGRSGPDGTTGMMETPAPAAERDGSVTVTKTVTTTVTETVTETVRVASRSLQALSDWTDDGNWDDDDDDWDDGEETWAGEADASAVPEAGWDEAVAREPYGRGDQELGPAAEEPTYELPYALAAGAESYPWEG